MIALLFAACSGDEAASSDGWALDDPAFRFCHTPGANAEDAKAWCALLPDDPADDRCPGLRATCDQGVVTADPEPLGCSPGDGGDPTAGRFAGEPEAPPAEPRRVDCSDFDVEGWQAVLRWVTAFAVAIGIAFLARFLWATFGRARGRTRAPVAAAATVTVHTPVEDDDLPMAPPTDLLDAARRALAAGELAEAVRLARAAALRRLGERGRLVLHRARTDREYLRALATEAGLQGWLRVLVDSYALARWGGRLPSVASAEAALAAAERIVVAVALWFVLGLPAHAEPGYARYAPHGDAALLRLLELHGYAPGWRLRSLSALDHTTDVLVLDVSGITLDDQQWAGLRIWVEEGGLLVVAGDATSGFPELGTWQEAPPDSRVALGPALHEVLPVPVLPGGPVGGFTEGESWAIVTDTALRLLAVVAVGQGAVAAIADPRMLQNGAWVHPDNEEFVGELLRAAGWAPEEAVGDTGDRLVIQLATTAAAGAGSGAPEPDPFGAFAEARLLPFVLQLLATAALVALWRGWPFGRQKEPAEEGRRAFVEHVQALGTRYYRLGASGHALEALAALWLARLGPEGLEWAAARAGYAPDDARAFARWVVLAAETGAPGSEPSDLTRMEELWRVTRRSA